MYKETAYLLVIISIFISAVIETDIYLPAFTDMMYYFKQSEENIQRVLTWNFIGLCISGPIYGPLSDSYGRRKLLLLALSLFLGGSLVTIISDNFDYLIIGRILQGLGSGGCFTLGTAIIFDVFKKDKAIEALNKINIIVPFIMATAPLLGGYLNQEYGFRANFYAIAISVFNCLILCIFSLKETLPINLRVQFKLKQTLYNFLKIIINIQFLQLTTIISLVFAGLLCFLSTTAILFVVEFKVLKNNYPYYQFILLTAYLIASIFCGKLINKFGVFFVKRLGLGLIVLGTFFLAVTTFIYPKNAILLTIGMIPYTAGFIWLQTPYVTEVMELVPEIKGIAASILTSLRLLITASIVSTVARYYNGTIIPTTIALVIISLLLLLISTSYERKNKEKTSLF